MPDKNKRKNRKLSLFQLNITLLERDKLFIQSQNLFQRTEKIYIGLMGG